MEPKLQESLSGQRPVPVYVLPYADQDDEISLTDLWHVIMARKMLILFSLLVAILLASVYVFMDEPLYRSEAHLSPPQRKDVQELMSIAYGGEKGLEIKRYTPDIVYKAFLRNLKSKGLRREFFDAHDLANYYLADKPHTDTDIDRIFDKKFDGNLRVQTDKRDASFVVVSMGATDPVLAAQRLNQFVAFADERTVDQLLDDVNVAIQAGIERVRYQLARKLKLAAQRRHDTVLKMKEALRVAGALSIESAGGLAVVADKKNAAIEINTAQIPLYMRGTKALKIEIAVLESRKSDEPFIAGLRELQEKRAFLEGILTDRGQLSAVAIDLAARPPYQAEKPRKKLVFMLAVMFGLMAGVFLVFIAEFRAKAREQAKQHSA